MQHRIFYRTAAAVLAVAVGLWVSPWAVALAPESAGQETVVSALYDAMDTALREQAQLPAEEPEGDTGTPVQPNAATDSTGDEISVSIAWGSMEFTYGSTWDPENLTYTTASGWIVQGTNDQFTVKNGGTAVNVTVAYEKASTDGIEGTLYTVSGTTESPVDADSKIPFTKTDEKTYKLKLTGTPEKIMTMPTTVGTITVTVTTPDTGTESTLSMEDTTEAVS